MREEAEHLAFWGLVEEPENEFKTVCQYFDSSKTQVK